MVVVVGGGVAVIAVLFVLCTSSLFHLFPPLVDLYFRTVVLRMSKRNCYYPNHLLLKYCISTALLNCVGGLS